MRAARLRRSSDIARVRAEGRPIRRTYFVARVRPSELAELRLCVVSPRSIGHSVARNRARRRVREAFRHVVSAQMPSRGIDVVVTARPEALLADFRTLEADAASTLGEADR